MTRKNTAGGAKQRAVDTASQVVPLAKSAGLAAKQSAEDAVKDARTWVAPHVEQAGIAVRDKIAPTISSVLVEAAHRLDDSSPRRRRWPRLLAGFAMLAAAGSAVAAIMLRRRPDFASVSAEGDSATPAPGTDNGSAARPAAAPAEEESADGRHTGTS
jgi:ribosomal protein L31E